jgi:hypothetical protein
VNRYSSPNLLVTSSVIAASAASSIIALEAATVMVVPGPADEHHQAHDRGAADGFAAARHPDLRALKRSTAWTNLAEARACRPRLLMIRNLAWRSLPAGTARPGLRRLVAHLPARTRLAMVTYLRPASWAIAIASVSVTLLAHLGELHQHGKIDARKHFDLRPAHAGYCQVGWRAAEHVGEDRDAVATESTRLTASMMSLRQRSESSSAPIVIGFDLLLCGPMTCSSAALNSSARRPWVTSTRPIIGKLLAGAFGAPHERATLTIQSPRARGDVRVSP